MVRDLDSYEQVEESVIQQRAEATKDKSLLHLLKIAQEWRDADCTPVFIIAQHDPMVIAVVSEETFGIDFN